MALFALFTFLYETVINLFDFVLSFFVHPISIFYNFSSEKWKLVSEDIKKELNISETVDGEFWINFEDFCKFFSRVYICTLGPDFDQDGKVDISKLIRLFRLRDKCNYMVSDYCA